MFIFFKLKKKMYIHCKSKKVETNLLIYYLNRNLDTIYMEVLGRNFKEFYIKWFEE